MMSFRLAWIMMVAVMMMLMMMIRMLLPGCLCVVLTIGAGWRQAGCVQIELELIAGFDWSSKLMAVQTLARCALFWQRSNNEVDDQ